MSYDDIPARLAPVWGTKAETRPPIKGDESRDSAHGRGHVNPALGTLLRRSTRLSADPPRGISQRWLVRDADDENGGFTLGLWESNEAVSEWLNSSAFAAIEEEMRPFFVGDYQVHTCEVRLHDVVGAGGLRKRNRWRRWPCSPRNTHYLLTRRSDSSFVRIGWSVGQGQPRGAIHGRLSSESTNPRKSSRPPANIVCNGPWAVTSRSTETIHRRPPAGCRRRRVHRARLRCDDGGRHRFACRRDAGDVLPSLQEQVRDHRGADGAGEHFRPRWDALRDLPPRPSRARFTPGSAQPHMRGRRIAN